ncbi:hypothetical protein [Streptomyces sp. NPDC003393]
MLIGRSTGVSPPWKRTCTLGVRLSSTRRSPCDRHRFPRRAAPDQIAALSAGSRPAEDEILAADVAFTLTRGGAVPGPLYDAAVAKLGQQGFAAVAFIASTIWRSAPRSTRMTCSPAAP